MKNKKTPRQKKQMSAWLDLHHDGLGKMTWGIECDDPGLTFDGHFICIFPQHTEERDDGGSFRRAQATLEYMQGRKQVAR